METEEAIQTIETQRAVIDLTLYHGKSIAALDEAKCAVITCEEEEGMAANSRAQIKAEMKTVEEFRKKEVTPFNDLVKRVNDMFRPIADTYDEAVRTIDTKILTYRKEVEKRRKEEEARLQKEHEERVKAEQEKAKAEKREAQVVLPPPVLLPQATTVKTSTAKATVRKTWTFEVTDETLVPRAYLCVNEKAIKGAISGGTRTIPGVRIFEQESIAGGFR